MRCLSCNVVLTDEESMLKYKWNEPIDLCFRCLEKSYLEEVNETMSVYDDEKHSH